MRETAEIGVIGGSGFYAFLDDAREVVVETPYGPPSDSLFLGDVAGRHRCRRAPHPRGARREERPLRADPRRERDVRVVRPEPELEHLRLVLGQLHERLEPLGGRWEIESVMVEKLAE